MSVSLWLVVWIGVDERGQAEERRRRATARRRRPPGPGRAPVCDADATAEPREPPCPRDARDSVTDRGDGKSVGEQLLHRTGTVFSKRRQLGLTASGSAHPSGAGLGVRAGPQGLAFIPPGSPHHPQPLLLPRGEPELCRPHRSKVGPYRVGGGNPLLWILGPCVIESRDHCLGVAARSEAASPTSWNSRSCSRRQFDKANRTSGKSFRGVGHGRRA